MRYPVDLKKAAAMLDAAGYKAGAHGERFKLTIDYLPGADDQQKTVAEYVRGQLKKVGIAVEVRASADFPAWAKRIASHDFDMSMDLVFNWGDPIIGVHRTYLSTNIKPVVWTNTQSYSNPKVDELLNTAGGIIDPTSSARPTTPTFEKIVTDELPIVFINQVPYHTAASKKLGERAEPDLGADVAATTRSTSSTRRAGATTHAALHRIAPAAGPGPGAGGGDPQLRAGARRARRSGGDHRRRQRRHVARADGAAAHAVRARPPAAGAAGRLPRQGAAAATSATPTSSTCPSPR